MSTVDDEQLARLDARYARRDATPTLDEQFVSASLGPYQQPFVPDTTAYFFVAPFPLTIVTGFFYLYSGVTASDTDYLSIGLGRRHAGAYATIVEGRTRRSGADSWAGNLPYGYAYSWNAMVWNAAAANLDPGDTLGFTVRSTGAAKLPHGPAAVTVGIVPR
ncbi:hypothetical protein GCM10022220_11910 [Actinocatenispora rupis]|uniref:Uncharacterized protein n=1 Tax=Actinocatenispora rupis TaxID=519421 RepID=A0A8J3N807_9ACTN|nr:hypothetical protein Aru02nite_07030 [Actinocatenispora rupis]